MDTQNVFSLTVQYAGKEKTVLISFMIFLMIVLMSFMISSQFSYN